MKWKMASNSLFTILLRRRGGSVRPSSADINGSVQPRRGISDASRCVNRGDSYQCVVRRAMNLELRLHGPAVVTCTPHLTAPAGRGSFAATRSPQRMSAHGRKQSVKTVFRKVWDVWSNARMKGGEGGEAGINLGINDKGATPFDVTP